MDVEKEIKELEKKIAAKKAAIEKDAERLKKLEKKNNPKKTGKKK